jgi:hypothetical protein
MLPNLLCLSVGADEGTVANPLRRLPDDVLCKILERKVQVSVAQAIIGFKQMRMLQVECSHASVSTALKNLIDSNIAQFPRPHYAYGVGFTNSTHRVTPTMFTLVGHENLNRVYNTIDTFMSEQQYARTEHAVTTSPIVQIGRNLGNGTVIFSTFTRDQLPMFRRMRIACAIDA